MKIYVIAGTSEEARRWINSNLEKRSKRGETTLSMSEYVYVSNADRLRGIQDPHGVFVGNWLSRPDIFDIVQRLMMQSVHVNPTLRNIYNVLYQSQLRGKQATSIIVDEFDELV